MTEDQKRVLIVDDEEMIRNVVVRIMKIKGHTSKEAEDGEKAISILKEDSNFDYTILDLSMPGTVSGENVFEYINQNHPNIKVIISTGFIDQETRNNFLSQGAIAILEKPYKIDQILELVS